MDKSLETKVFISHRTSDERIAGLILDFLVGTGIPRDRIFISSLPGNDVKESISKEVKDAIKCSVVNIAILSSDYYQSAYCLNEAGIIWFQDNTRTIPIGMPEINPNNMYGFLNSEYKLRRLNVNTDIAYICDTVHEALGLSNPNTSQIVYETDKIINNYIQYLKTREEPYHDNSQINDGFIKKLTDDEKIVLLYIIKNEVRKVSKQTINLWLQDNEIYKVDIDNAFDLLSNLSSGINSRDYLELGIEMFRMCISKKHTIIHSLEECVNAHIRLASNSFEELFRQGKLEPIIILFAAYINEKQVTRFGDRWMAKFDIETIKDWEDTNNLDSSLSSNYYDALSFFIKHNFVFESDWTSYDNPREYSLHKSLKDYLFNCNDELKNSIEQVKKIYDRDFPY